MSDTVFYLNDNYPLTADVFAPDGVTPVLPQSATIDIVNQVTGDTLVTEGSCTVASGLATYYVLSGSDVAQNPGIYMGYMRVTFDAITTQTIALPFDVLDKKSYLAVDRWRNKVEDSAPDSEHISDEHGREWIDQAVDYLNGRFALGYTSLLGTISPAPTTNDLEFIASVASLMARTMWWAGKGNWKDGELSYFGTPLQQEWEKLDDQIGIIVSATDGEDWFSDTTSADMYNRDRTYWDGRKYDSPHYWHRNPGDTIPVSDIPI